MIHWLSSVSSVYNRKVVMRMSKTQVHKLTSAGRAIIAEKIGELVKDNLVEMVPVSKIPDDRSAWVSIKCQMFDQLKRELPGIFALVEGEDYLMHTEIEDGDDSDNV